MASASQWSDVWAPVSIRLVDALWHGDRADFAAQARRLSDELAAEGLDHDGRRIIAGLSIMRAEGLVAATYGLATEELRRVMRSEAERAKREHRFPWHLLDG